VDIVGINQLLNPLNRVSGINPSAPPSTPPFAGVDCTTVFPDPAVRPCSLSARSLLRRGTSRSARPQSLERFVNNLLIIRREKGYCNDVSRCFGARQPRHPQSHRPHLRVRPACAGRPRGCLRAPPHLALGVAVRAKMESEPSSSRSRRGARARWSGSSAPPNLLCALDQNPILVTFSLQPIPQTSYPVPYTLHPTTHTNTPHNRYITNVYVPCSLHLVP